MSREQEGSGSMFMFSVITYVLLMFLLWTGSTEGSGAPKVDIEVVNSSRLDGLPAGSKTVYFFAEENVQLKCRTVAGEEIEDEVNWSKDGYNFNCSHCTIQGNELVMNSVTSADSAAYRCHVKRKTSGPRVMEVKDWRHTTVPVILPPWNQTAELQSDTSIVFFARNADLYTFRRENGEPYGEPVQTGPTLRFRNMDDGRLLIYNVSQDDAVTYIIKAINTETGQSAKASLEFKVQEEPTLLTHLDTSSHHTLTNPSSNSTMFSTQYLVSPSQNQGYTTSQVTTEVSFKDVKSPGSDNEVTITTGNKVHKSNDRYTITVITIPGVVLLLLVIFIYCIYQQYRRKQKNNTIERMREESRKNHQHTHEQLDRMTEENRENYHCIGEQNERMGDESRQNHRYTQMQNEDMRNESRKNHQRTLEQTNRMREENRQNYQCIAENNKRMRFESRQYHQYTQEQIEDTRDESRQNHQRILKERMREEVRQSSGTHEQNEQSINENRASSAYS